MNKFFVRTVDAEFRVKDISDTELIRPPIITWMKFKP
jgi:hypothetical protein